MVKGVQIEFIVAVLDSFYGAPAGHRQWFHQPDFDVYLRTGSREFHRRSYHALTIGDVTVKEGARGCGVFSDLLLDVECCAMLLRCNAVLAENVRRELINPLARRGYQIRADSMQFDMLRPLEGVL